MARLAACEMQLQHLLLAQSKGLPRAGVNAADERSDDVRSWCERRQLVEAALGADRGSRGSRGDREAFLSALLDAR